MSRCILASTTGFHHWLVRWGRWSGSWAMYMGVQTMGTTWQAAREKINFLPNNRSSRRRRPASSLVSGGWVVVRKSYSEMK